MGSQGHKQPKFLEITSPHAEIKLLDKRLLEMAAESNVKSETIKALQRACMDAATEITNLRETLAARDERINYLNAKVLEAEQTEEANDRNQDYYLATVRLLKNGMKVEGVSKSEVDQTYIVGSITFRLVFRAEITYGETPPEPS